MIKSYFFLNRQILDLRDFILNKKITEAFTQEKEKLVIEFENEDNLYLEFCVNHSLPYYLIKDFFIRSKKNSLDFFKNLRNKKIIDLLIANDDRVVAFLLDDNSVLYFTIRGKLTNVYYKTSSEFLSFKKIDEKDLLDVETDLLSKNYINEFNIPNLSSIENIEDENFLRKQLPIFGKEIIQIAKTISQSSLADGLKKVLETIKSSNPIILINHKDYEIRFSFQNLPHNINDYDLYEFENTNDALNFYIKENHQLSSRKEITEIIIKHIDKELKRISNRQNNLLTIIQLGNKEDELRKIGNLLLVNLNKVRPGMKQILIQDFYNNDKLIEVNLDPKLSPKENVEQYFNKAKESKIQYEKAKELIEVISKEKKKLTEIKDKVLNAKSIKELGQIAKGLKLKMKSEKSINESITEKFKHYLVDGRYNVYVGKDNKSNDLLTLKFAKQNDYWFHARSVPGSHVVLRIDNTKESVPKSVLKKVASLAAYHSKAKTAGIVPVSYTFKKFVVKRKGMEPGKVALLREETLLVSPEIPEGVEFLES
ncbi:MAG: NFACT RNA binding domain-containing protein [Ignavibacterium sp.]|uniref:NFACT RNA binding domain-containing protein n=1 Tax=Ignavibacterium sp. TaxID=2651167 RepID=UPI00404A5905